MICWRVLINTTEEKLGRMKTLRIEKLKQGAAQMFVMVYIEPFTKEFPWNML
jgi:hypothetical protein